MTQQKQPIHRIRIGALGVAIFENISEEGKRSYNSTFDRSYLEEDTWKHTKSFRKNDLLVLAKLSDLTHTWIVEQLRTPSNEDQNSEE